MKPREHLATERRHPATTGLGEATAAEAFDLFDELDREVVAAVRAAKPEIVRTIELVAERLSRGGRLFYIGAGTSGRLGVLDASECPPTFQSDPRCVQGIIAGGDLALRLPIEGAEDSETAGEEAMDKRRVGPGDVVLGITAGGTTPYVHAALQRAKERHAATVFLACVPTSEVTDTADISIRLPTGPEGLAGSTRLKAGTATKLVLNRISTIAMARLGKVHENLMVDVNAGANTKLWQRATVILSALTGLEREPAEALLLRCGGNVKRAAVVHTHGITPEQATQRLEQAGGFLRAALGESPT